MFVEQTVGGKTYKQKRIIYQANSNHAIWLMCLSMDEWLLRESGAVLLERVWWVVKES